MRITVIGGTGHVGGYLVPRLVRAGHDVVVLSRGGAPHYRREPEWDRVEIVQADREAEDEAGTFAARVAALDADVVVDMICFTPESARMLVDAIRPRASHLLMCTSIWAKGSLTAVPAEEDEASEPWGTYGIGKAAIEALLAEEGERPDGVRSTSLRPGHISGPGWAVINPAGNVDAAVWEALAAGDPVTLPNLGLETVHHVHADDVAQAFELALARTDGPRAARFNVVSERALSLKGFAQAVARGFGQDADLRFRPIDEFRAAAGEHGETTFEHVARSQSMSIRHAREVLGYAPRYTSLQAVAEAVNDARDRGELDLRGRVLVV